MKSRPHHNVVVVGHDLNGQPRYAALRGMNPKELQYIMGHSNITMTLNYYAHATFASAKTGMERLIAA